MSVLIIMARLLSDSLAMGGATSGMSLQVMTLDLKARVGTSSFYPLTLVRSEKCPLAFQ